MPLPKVMYVNLQKSRLSWIQARNVHMQNTVMWCVFQTVCEEKMYSLQSLPPSNPHQKYDVSRIITTATRYVPIYLSIVKQGDNVLGTVRPSVCLSVHQSALSSLTYDLDIRYVGPPWPWLGWDCRSMSYVKGQRARIPITSLRCVSVISGCMRAIAQMRSIGFE